ncbi:MAG: GTP-binding protein era-like protein [uncultured bacterium (gcode 4)]|uniref:GTPase Era n=1 Tax=uncultured bacterium (gcode 4) TaxID=1234023 RepID=K2GZ25_9BACT|nr:MAG: GTP-binding protein era-like protein [uncultured bacterium (gcode 4)]
MEIPIKKVWYVALIWRPNSWKSTFINALIDEKVSIVSPRPQTTQKCIRWIYNDDDSQIIFFDTPGVNEWKEEFFQHLKWNVIDSVKNADLILRFVDSSRQSWWEEDLITSILQNVTKKIITVYTKSDIASVNMPQNELKISSINKKWFEELLSEVKKYLPTWPLYYDEDYYTDQDTETRIAEIIREKIFLNFKEEIPHSVFVEIGEIEDKPEILRIQAYIYTESDSQKIIIIGKGGQALTTIWSEARRDLEEIFGKKIFLSLRVKSLPKWKKNKKLLSKLY